MAKINIVVNGQVIEKDERDIQRPPKLEKQKRVSFGRKDTILLKWLAGKFNMNINQVKNELDAIADNEPDDVGPS